MCIYQMSSKSYAYDLILNLYLLLKSQQQINKCETW